MQSLGYRGYNLAVTWEIPWYAVQIDAVDPDCRELAPENKCLWMPTTEKAIAEAKVRVDAMLAGNRHHGLGLLEFVSRLPRPLVAWRKRPAV